MCYNDNVKKVTLLIAIVLLATACTATAHSEPTLAVTPTPTATVTPTFTPEPTYTPYPTRPAATIAPKSIQISPSFIPEVPTILDRLKACSQQMYDFVQEQVIWIVPIPPEYARPGQNGYLCVPTGCIALNPDIIETAKRADGAEYRMMLVIAHEARHVWQERTNMQCTYAECEQDADRFTLPLLDQCPAADPRTIEGNRIVITTRIADPPTGPPP